MDRPFHLQEKEYKIYLYIIWISLHKSNYIISQCTPTFQAPSNEAHTMSLAMSALNKSLDETTGSMAQLSTKNRHDTTAEDKESDEKRIQVSFFKSPNDSIRYTASSIPSPSVIKSESSINTYKISVSQTNHDKNNIFSVGGPSFIPTSSSKCMG